ncbi:hypothetical protein FJ980_16660 [Mesorhizobium sp. B1-1-5]|nr:hypothetical protein FJ980_16660 [Mesorhizobium sp. B1-1-5]
MARAEPWGDSPVVIHGRSKERSDAAQTRGSMPSRLPQNTAAQKSAPMAPLSAPLQLSEFTEWILGSARPLRSRSARG